MDLKEFTEQINKSIDSEEHISAEKLYNLYNLYRYYKYLIKGVHRTGPKDRKYILSFFKEEVRDSLVVLQVCLAYDCAPGQKCPQDLPYDYIIVDIKEKEAWSFRDLVYHGNKTTFGA